MSQMPSGQLDEDTSCGIFMFYKPLPNVLFNVNNLVTQLGFITHITYMRKLRLRETKWIIQDHKDCSRSHFPWFQVSRKGFKRKLPGVIAANRWGIRVYFSSCFCEGFHLLLEGCRGLGRGWGIQEGSGDESSQDTLRGPYGLVRTL